MHGGKTGSFSHGFPRISPQSSALSTFFALFRLALHTAMAFVQR